MRTFKYRMALVALTVCFSSDLAAREYNRSNYPYSRSDFGCLSPLDKVVDINTGATILCKFADLDHRVSLREAFNAKLPDATIRQLATDKNNLVWTQSSINRAKGPLSSSGFESVLKKRGDYDGRRFNKHLRATIVTKQKYGIPLDTRETSFAFAAMKRAPTKTVTKIVPGLKFNDAVEQVTKKYGKKIATKAAIRVGGSFVPGPGWVVAGTLIGADVGWWALTGDCAVCEAMSYLSELTKDQKIVETIQNPIPLLEYEEMYHISRTSYVEIKSEYDHLINLLEADPWMIKNDTIIYKDYLEQLKIELMKRKFSN